MNHLRYSSNEMFSSTHLIRQSKQIFDKLQEKEIEKAVILRDGKPSFIMLDFDSYEKVMEEFDTNWIYNDEGYPNTITLLKNKN